MKREILYFSPTGNTRFLADKLAEKLKCNIINFTEEPSCEHLVIMSSIHAFRLPSVLKTKIKKAKSVSIIMIGCNTSKINYAAGNFLLKQAKKCNVEVMHYKLLAMPLTIVKSFDENYGKKIVSESITEIERISKLILNSQKEVIKASFSSKILLPIYHVENIFVKLFGLELFANDKCVKCKKCISICPKKNIYFKNKIKFKLNCMMCMSCIYNCPKKAIHPRISKFVEFKEGYDLNKYIDK